MKLSKIVKRLFIFIIVLVILVIGAAIAIPYFFKDEILEKIKQEANATLNAKVDFEDVNLSLLRSFPDFSFEMKNLKMEGVDAFEGVPLVEAEDIDFTLDLMSVIKSDRPIEVQSVTLTKPNVNILILKNGVANYDIVKPSNGNTADTESSGEYDFLIQLKKYTIEDGNFVYDDRAGNIFLELKNLNHTGKGDFTQDVFDLVTKTSISALTAKSGGITYLKKANANLDATFNIDMINSKYTLADNDLKINAMNLLADGWVQLENNDDIKIDFTFNAPKNDFKHLLSLIPSAFTQDFSNVKTGGQMAFNGYVKGTYNGEKERLPAFKIDLDVSNGSFQYPDLPMGMSNIFTKVNIESPSSNLDKMKIDIPDFKLALGGKPFEGRFKLRTPISDPDIDTKVKGTIDLADINKAFPLDGVTQLSGIIDADVVAKTRLSTIEKGDYESANINGDASVKNLVYVADGLPKIIIKESQMTFTPQKAIVKNFDAKLGKSDLQAHGNIDNILAYFSPKKTMTGDLVIRSEYFNVTEWMGEEEAASAATPAPNTAAAETEIFDRFKFKIDAKIGKIDYDVYQLLHSSTTGTFSSNELIINDFQTNLGKSDLSGKGKLTNIFNYVFKNETLGGDLAIRSDFFDLNPFMEEDNSVKTKTIAYNETENLEPLLIPDNIDVSINAKIKKLLYTNIDLKDFSGKLLVKDSKVKMQNVTARTFGGQVEADGYYDTKDAKNPKYKLAYDIKKFDFRNSFKKLNTIQKLAPIAQYIQGNFSSKMTLEGVVGKDMMPDLNTLTADGFLQTVNGFITNFKPLNEIGDKLNIKKLKSHKINLKGTKNWFEVKDGRVVVKEFPLKYQGIDMKIAGSHGISQDIDYDILAKIPTKLIDKNPVGSAAKKGLALLNSQASKLGLNIDAGEFVNVKIKLTGSISKPKVSFKLVGSGGTSVKEVVTQKLNEVKDSVITEVKEVVDNQKEKLEAEARAKKAALEKEMNARIKRINDAAEKSANKVREEGKKAAAQVKTEGYKQADLLVQKAGSNPFKKKAAQIAAKKLKKETDKKADQIIQKANKNADKITQQADQKTAKIKKEYQDRIDKL